MVILRNSEFIGMRLAPVFASLKGWDSSRLRSMDAPATEQIGPRTNFALAIIVRHTRRRLMNGGPLLTSSMPSNSSALRGMHLRSNGGSKSPKSVFVRNNLPVSENVLGQVRKPILVPVSENVPGKRNSWEIHQYRNPYHYLEEELAI